MSRILFADPNRFTQRMGIQHLAAEGHEVVGVSAGNDALRYIRERHPDVAILDTQMPELSGLELCKKIKSDAGLRATKVVLLDSVLHPIPVAEAEKAASDALLLKPLDGAVLAATVRWLTEGMNSEFSAAVETSKVAPANGSRPLATEPPRQSDELSTLTPRENATMFSDGTNALGELHLCVARAAAARDNQPLAADIRASVCGPVSVTSSNGDKPESEGAAFAPAPRSAVVTAAPGMEVQKMNEAEVSVEPEQEVSPQVDFVAIIDEALGNDAAEPELRKRVEQAISQILQPAISALAAQVTGEIYSAYRAQRRVEEAVNGLLLPTVVSIADASRRGVLAAFRSR